MRYSEVKSAVLSVLSRTPTQAVCISGPPGVAKSAAALDAVCTLYPDLPDDRILISHLPLADSVDFRGVPVPSAERDFTKWLPAEDIYRFRNGTGPGAIIYDDRGQASVQVKNVVARLLLDRAMDSVKLDPAVIQISTTNRVEDKAGTGRDPSQLSNREACFEMDAHLDDWCTWAVVNGIDPMLIAFLRLRPDQLHDFDPNRPRNPTPRTWEMVSRSCDPSLERSMFLSTVTAFVGQGAAIEYVGFRDLAAKMPSIDVIMMNPDKAEVPSEPGVLYAVVTALAMRATKDNFDRIMRYLDRLPVEFSTVGVKDAILKEPGVKGSKAFVDWAIKHKNVFA